MSNKNKNNGEISLEAIVFFLIIAPPIGVFLVIVKYILPMLHALLTGSDTLFSRKNRYSGYEKKDADKVFAEFWESTSGSDKAEDNGKRNESGRKKTADDVHGTAEPSTAKEKLPYKVSSVIFLALSAVCLAVVLTTLGGNLLLSGLPLSVIVQILPSYTAQILLSVTGTVLGGIGISQRRIYRLAKMYVSVIGTRGSVDLDELESSLSRPRKRVMKELGRVIDTGVFGQYAYIDIGRGLFLRNSTYAPRDRENTEEKREGGEAVKDEYAETLSKIRRLNDEIDDVPVSDRIDLIEEYTRRIFEFMKKNPEREKDVHTFMTYYLPMTLKLLESYSEIERVGVAGDNMQSAKESIEKTLDMLVEGYKRLLDKLYESENLDISSDIDVLERMMRKDGLAGDGFDLK